MSSYTNIFGGSLLQPSFSFYKAITLSSNITLSFNTDFGPNPFVVASIMDITPTNNGFSLIMPDARNVSVGFSFSIDNRTAFTFNLVANDGVTVIDEIGGPSFSTFYLSDNSTANGTWQLVPYGTGSGSVTSVAVSTSGTNGNIVTTGSPITLAGTIALTLGEDLAGLTGLGGSTGIAVRTSGAGAWSTTTLTGTVNQIAIANANGVGGSPTFGLTPAITAINSISLAGGNLDFGVTPNTIAANNANGGITLATLGTGAIALNSDFVNVNGILLLNDQPIVFHRASSPGFLISIQPPVTIPGTYTITLPNNIGTLNQVLEISSSTPSGSGTLLGTSWASVGSGTVTSVTAGANLTGGTITGTGTIALNPTLTGLNTVTIDGTAQGSGIVTSPPVSAAVNITFGNGYQNASGYDALFTVIISISATTPGNIEVGVGITDTPALVAFAIDTNDLGPLTIPVYVPSNYFIYIGVSGVTAVVLNTIVTYI